MILDVIRIDWCPNYLSTYVNFLQNYKWFQLTTIHNSNHHEILHILEVYFCEWNKHLYSEVCYEY